MKKKISLWLAMVILLNTLLVTGPPVQANISPNFNNMKVSLDNHLTPDYPNNNFIPDWASNNSQGNQATISWDIGLFEAGEKYVLTYYIDNGANVLKAELTLTYLTDTNYRVDFRLYDFDDSTIDKWVERTEMYQNVTPPALSVYYSLKIPPLDNGEYIGVDRFFTEYGNYFGADNVPRVSNRNPYDDTNNPSGISNFTQQELAAFLETANDPNFFARMWPIFNIKEGTGFSFRYHGYNISFLWEGNNFNFTTDRLSMGRIYQFDLEYLPSVPPLDDPREHPNYKTISKKAFLGIDLSKFRAIPIAGGGAGDNRAVLNEDLNDEPDFDYFNPGNPNNAFDTSTIVIDTDNNPASAENRLSLRFNLPIIFDYGSVKNNPQFVSIKSVNTGKLGVTLNMISTYTQSPKSMSIIMSDLNNIIVSGETSGLNATTDPSLNSNGATVYAASLIKGFPQSNNIPSDAVRDRDTDRVEIILGDLAPNMVFDSVSMVFSSSDPLMATTNQNINSVYRPVFTFMEFEKQLFGEKLYIKAKPYPYLGANRGEYRLRVLSTSGIEYVNQNNGGFDPSVTRAADGGEWIWFPIGLDPFDASIANIFQVIYTQGKFEESDKMKEPYPADALYSQIVEIRPDPDAPLIGMPNNFRILNGMDYYRNYPAVDKTIRQYPTPNTINSQEGMVDFWAQWDIGDEKLIKNMLDKAEQEKPGVTPVAITIDYEIYKSLKPIVDIDPLDPSKASDLSELKFTTVRVTIERTSPGALELQVSYTDMDNGTTSSVVQPYDADDPTAGLLKYRLNASQTTRTYYADVHFIAETGLATGGNLNKDFLFPNIYFLCVKPIQVQYGNMTKPQEIYMPLSSFDTITLNDLSQLSVPPPQNLTARSYAIPVYQETLPAAEISMDIPGAALKQYFNALPDYDLSQITINLYVGQQENIIKSQYYPNNSVPLTLEQRSDKAEVTFSYKDGDLLNDPELRNNAFHLATDEAMMDALRKGRQSGVVMIKDIPLIPREDKTDEEWLEAQGEITKGIKKYGSTLPLKILLDGLDWNQQYYFFADLVVTQYTRDEQGELHVEKYLPTSTQPSRDMIDPSIFTGIAGATTADDKLNAPEPDERKPASPLLTADRDSITDQSVILSWNTITAAPGEVTPPDAITFEYQLIRLENTRMSDEAYSSTENTGFKEFFDNLENRNKLGWIIDQEDSTVRVYNEPGNPSAFILVPADSDKYKYEPAWRNIPIRFTDMTLLPNHLYFYYVRVMRTVTTIDPKTGEEKVRRAMSGWSGVSVTTHPVQAPKDLKVESSMAYDRMTEVKISFNAQVDLTKLDVDYKLQYQLKPDSDDWLDPKDMNKTQLTDPDNISNNNDGTTHFIYHIAGLEPNTLYSLRVRLYDINADEGSLYSNVVQFKTDMDQEEYDDDHRVGNWMDYLEKLLAELIKDPYWLAQENASALTVVYRPGDMFNTVLGASSDASVWLYNNGANTATYYIPATVLQAAQNAGKGFRISYDDLTVMLPTRFIDRNYNDAVISISNYVKTKEINDYFIRVSITRSRISGLVESETPLGRQTNVKMELVGVSSAVGDIQSWDKKLYAEFAEILDKKLNNQDIKKAMTEQVKDNNILSQDMIKYIEKLVADTKTDLLKVVNDNLRTRTGSVGILSTRVTNVNKMDAAMTLIADVGDNGALTSVNGYQLQNSSWMPRAVSDYYNGKGMTSTVPGTFVFTGHTINIPGIDTTLDGGYIGSLVAKYALDDYLGRGGVDMKQTATRLMVAGCIARMAGAPKTADPISWIPSNLNMTLSSRSANGAVQVQETLAMVMALYEKKTNTPVSSITIRNYTTTAGMTGLDARYAQAVRASFEIELVNDTSIRPAASVTIGQLLEILAALDKKVKL
jgi:hypothetical protein